jgi:hypothetical protein
MNMFRINVSEPPWVGLRRIALAVVGMLNVMVAVALALYLAAGPFGLYIFLGTWPITAFVGLMAGLFFTPDPKPDRGTDGWRLR